MRTHPLATLFVAGLLATSCTASDERALLDADTGSDTTTASLTSGEEASDGAEVLIGGTVFLGGPLAGATVSISAADGTSLSSDTTATTGAFIASAPAGSGTVTLTATGGTLADGRLSPGTLSAVVDVGTEAVWTSVNIPTTIEHRWQVAHPDASPADADMAVAALLGIPGDHPLAIGSADWSANFDDVAFVDAAAAAGGIDAFADQVVAADVPVSFPPAADNAPGGTGASFAGIFVPGGGGLAVSPVSIGLTLAGPVFTVLSHRLFGKLFPTDDSSALAEINAKLTEIQDSLAQMHQELSAINSLIQQVSTQLATLGADDAVTRIERVWADYLLLDAAAQAKVAAPDDDAVDRKLVAAMNAFQNDYNSNQISSAAGKIGQALFTGSGGVSIMKAYSAQLISDGFFIGAESAQLLTIYMHYENAQGLAALMEGKTLAVADELASRDGKPQDSTDLVLAAASRFDALITAQRQQVPQQLPPSTVVHVPTNTMWFWRISNPSINGQQEAQNYFNTVGGAFPGIPFRVPTADEVRQLISGRGSQAGDDYLNGRAILVKGVDTRVNGEMYPFWDTARHYPQSAIMTSQTDSFDAEGGCPAEYRWAVNLADGVEQRLPIGFKQTGFGNELKNWMGTSLEVFGVKYAGTPDPTRPSDWYSFCEAKWLLMRSLSGAASDPQITIGTAAGSPPFTLEWSPDADERVVHGFDTTVTRPYFIQ